MLEVYVQSAGNPQELGYCWLDQAPTLLSKSNVVKLLEPNSHSLVIARSDGQLFLLIVGLSSSRQDFRGRVIRNTVLWVSPDGKEEEQLRAIAVSALRNELTEKVDQLIWTDDAIGFDFDRDKLPRLDVGIQPTNEEPEQQCKIAKLSDALRKKLASELERCRLPDGNGPLVIMTGNRNESALIEIPVWRGLSKLVKSDADKWKDIRDPETGEKVFFAIAIALILLVAIVILVAVLLTREPERDPAEDLALPTQTSKVQENIETSEIQENLLETSSQQLTIYPQESVDSQTNLENP